ncbi:MAG TPA: DUF4389 domain-containing protein, partial [Polyangiales bacterium]|nr:DUF4389 domain-containing protein [Polyangiales bacterium]
HDSVRVEVAPAAQFQRVHLLLRVLVVAALSMLHGSDLGLFGLLYFFLPVIAAILVAQRGAARYLGSDASWLVPLLEWVLGFYAYMLFVTDVFPLGQAERAVRLRVSAAGSPSVGSALLRLLTSIPFLLVLLLIGLGSFVISVIAALNILLFQSYPRAMRSFQQDVIGWMARLFAYHASLVEDYPSLSYAARTRDAQA